MIYFFKERKRNENSERKIRYFRLFFSSNLLRVRNLELKIRTCSRECIERAYFFFFFEKNKRSSPKREPLFPKVRLEKYIAAFFHKRELFKLKFETFDRRTRNDNLHIHDDRKPQTMLPRLVHSISYFQYDYLMKHVTYLYILIKS